MEELADFLILSVPRASEEQALRDVITRHGIPWMELRGEYERLVALDKDAAEVMKLISDRVDDKAGLFADLCGYGELQDMRTIQDLDRLTRKGTVARGWVGFSTPDGGVLRRKVLPDGTTVIINGEYTIDFHSIDGRWHLGVGDEGVEESENAGAEKTR
jgi:hypothetical protein